MAPTTPATWYKSHFTSSGQAAAASAKAERRASAVSSAENPEATGLAAADAADELEYSAKRHPEGYEGKKATGVKGWLRFGVWYNGN